MATIPTTARILVIDDNLIVQRAVHFALRDRGYEVLMASDVATAMKAIRHGKLDLVLLDLSFPMDATDIGNLPQDGFFFIDWIHRTPGISRPPIIIISSTEPAQYLERAAAGGIKDCLKKPLDKETLLAAVQSVLGQKPVSEDPNPPAH